MRTPGALPRRTLLTAAGAALGAAALGAGTREERPAPSVLLLGDSLTYGQTGPTSAHPGGFRAPLHELLVARGVAHRFTGSRRDNGTLALVRAGQDAHEGWPGYRVDQAAELPLQPADVALVLLGTNDVGQRRHPARTAERLSALLVRLPVRAAVVVAPPPYLRSGRDLLPDPASADLAAAVLERGDDDRVRHVDAWTPFLRPDGTADRALVALDGTHLEPAGYGLLARLVAPALADALAR